MTSVNVEKYKWKNYLIVILCVFAISPFFNTVVNTYLICFLAYLFFVAVDRRVKLYDNQIIKILGLFYLLIIIQGFLYNGFSTAALYKPLIIFYLPYLIYNLLGISFIKYFLNVLYFVAIFTLPFWFLQSIIPAFDQFLRQAIDNVLPYSFGSVPRSLLIYTAAWRDDMYYSSLGIYRNSGLFHEPGAYSVFLILGIIINILITGKVFEKKNRVFIFCLFTTLSTTGFITLFVVLIAYLFKVKINIGIKILAVVCFAAISYGVYTSEEFLQEKISTQYSDQTYAAQNNLGKFEGESGRFYAFFISVKLFFQHPIIGRGIVYASSEKASGEMHAEGSYLYGFTGVLATYGILFGFFYLINLFNGFKKIGQFTNQPFLFIISVFIAINMALLTQVFITSTIIVVIFFIGVYSKGVVISNTKVEKNKLQLV